jgi:predicted PurR-regulated permease PerM
VDHVTPAREQHRHAVIISDPRPVGGVDRVWVSIARAANVGIFLLLFGAFLYLGRTIMLPIFAAAVIALTLAPLVKAAKRHGVPTWITALLIAGVSLGVLSLALTATAGPVSAWIARAPDIWTSIKAKFAVLEAPLAAGRQLQSALFGSGSDTGFSTPNVVMPVVAFLTPAAGELVLFFVTLIFFLVWQFELRSGLVSLFARRESKLRFLRIMNDVEKNLTSYLFIVTCINIALGIVVALGAFALGFPNPIIFGVLAATLNYVPYVGPAVMVVILFGVGLVTFPSLGQALVAPIAFVALATAEGNFITPTIVGRRVTLNPLLILLALAFWTWMWGPIGAFLATPLTIVGLVVFNHLFPEEDVRLPE